MSTKRLNMRSVSYVIGVKTFDYINIELHGHLHVMLIRYRSRNEV